MRRFLILALLVPVAFAAYPNLQLAYRFQNTAVDWSGNGRNGTATNITYTTARSQQAAYFDGTGYVRTPSFGLSGTVLVFAADVRCILSRSTIQTLVGDASQIGGVGYIWCYRDANLNNLKWRYAYGLLGTAAHNTFFANPYNDAWLHLAVVCDYSNANTYFYRNGILLSTVAMAGAPLFPTTNRVKYVGSYNATPVSPLTLGYLRNVQLWTLAAMPAAAQMLANVNRLMMGMHPIW